MAFEDKSLECSDCGATFTFSADEQRFFESKGYTNEPKRCPSCRRARKSERYEGGGGGGGYGGGGGGGGYGGGGGGGYQRQMFPAVCAECGKETEVPFQPREDRPVYCRDCYNKISPRG